MQSSVTVPIDAIWRLLQPFDSHSCRKRDFCTRFSYGSRNSVDFARAVDKQMPHLPQRLRHIALYAVDLAFAQKEVRRPNGTFPNSHNSAIVSSLLVAVSSHLIILCLLCHRSLPRSLLQAFGRPLCSHPRAISSTRCTASRHRDREDSGFYRCCRAQNFAQIFC